MLITVSGMVGSGKSSTARQVVRILGDAGVECEYRRFRTQAMGVFRKRPDSEPVEKAKPSVPPGGRWAGFRLRRLTAVTACGYAARILAFRFFARQPASRCIVFDRYFYDSFVHYRLSTRRERLYAGVLAHLVPIPDVAILLRASSETIRARRPDFASEYVVAVNPEYDRLRSLFPQLVEIRSDEGEPPLERLAALVRDRVMISSAPPRSL